MGVVVGGVGGVSGESGLFWLKFLFAPFNVVDKSGVLLLACSCAAGILGAEAWNGLSLLSMKLRSIVVEPGEVVVRKGGRTGVSTFGKSVPSIFGGPLDVLGLALLAELSGRDGRDGALFNSSIDSSKILKLFLLAELFVLFFDEIEALSPSSPGLRGRGMASESLPLLSWGTLLLTLSFLLLTRGMGGSTGDALFKASGLISKILKLFLLAVLFFDDIETLSPSSRCFLDCGIASESLAPLSYDTVLMTFSFRLAMRGIGGSNGGAKLTLLFLLLAPSPSLVLGRKESNEGFDVSEKGDRGGSSKSNVIWSGLTSGVSLAWPLDTVVAVVAVAVEMFRPCAWCEKGAAGGGPGGMGGGAGVLMAGGGGAALRFFLENMMSAVDLASAHLDRAHVLERVRAAKCNLARRGTADPRSFIRPPTPGS